MLNRNNAPTMGIWNGVGGKIDAGEDAKISIQREIEEETGIMVELEEIVEKGIVTWHEGDIDYGGMYVYLAKVPNDLAYDTPIVTDEGILDWKEINWILDKNNDGVGECIPHFLPMLLIEEKQFHYSFYYVGKRVENVIIKERILV